MKTTHLVTQSNTLIEARHKQSLSAREQKLILTLVSMIQPDDKDFSKYEITIKDFHELLGLTGREKYKEIKEIVENLMAKVIYIPKGEKDWMVLHWVSVAEYRDGEGIIELKFDPALKPYLLQIKKAYTSYRLSNILSLKSGYSIRMYELIKKWEYVGKWNCTVDDLRGKLGISLKTYPQYGNFKQRVLDPAIKELNEKTDVNVTFTEQRVGRKVSKLEFIIRHIKEKEIQLEPPSVSHIPPVPPTTPAEDGSGMRERFNKQAEGYIFDAIAFEDIEKKAEAMWSEERELHIFRLLEHTNTVTLDNRAGYYRSIINRLHKMYLEGSQVDTEEFKPASGSKSKAYTKTRKTAIEQDELSEEEILARRTLLANLGLSPEEIEEKEKEYSH